MSKKAEISDEAWKLVHAAVKAFDPDEYEASTLRLDKLLQEIFDVMTDELERVATER